MGLDGQAVLLLVFVVEDTTGLKRKSMMMSPGTVHIQGHLYDSTISKVPRQSEGGCMFE